jgi:hypothetical protein
VLEPSIRAERVYAGYFAAQAVCGVVLWVLLASSGTFRSWFELMPDRHVVMDAFAFADVGLVVVGSVLSAWALEADKPWAVPALAFTAGAVMYPTLYLVDWVAVTGKGALCLAVMVPTATLSSWITYQVWRSRTAG